MALTPTNAQIFIQDGALPSVNLTSGTSIGLFTPGNTLTFGLQSTAGIQSASYQFNCPRYPGLDKLTFDWRQGMVNQFQVPIPANTDVLSPNLQAGIELVVTISDGASSVATAFNFLQSKGANAIPFQMYADYVVNSALPAYTNTSGTLVGNANGAITSGMADGVTPAVGDTFLLPGGIAAAGVDVGLYTITVVGSGSVKFTAVPAAGWTVGTIIMPKTEVLVAKGTVFKGTTWVNTLTGLTNAIGTASFSFYPRFVGQSIPALASGAATISNVPLLASNQTIILVSRTIVAGTVTNTVMYNPQSQPTTGNLGTALINIQASVAAGTVNAADTSTVEVGIWNQV